MAHRRGHPWSRQEVHLLEMAMRLGFSAGSIATRIGRTVTATSNKADSIVNKWIARGETPLRISLELHVPLAKVYVMIEAIERNITRSTGVEKA